MKNIPTPELDKIEKARDDSQKLGEFLEWLFGEKGCVIAKYHEHTPFCYGDDDSYDLVCGYHRDELHPIHSNINTLLAEYFGVDEAKAEQERRAILDALRKENRKSK